MSHLHTHLHGNLIEDPVFRTFENSDASLTKFRLAASRRRLVTQKSDTDGAQGTNANQVWEDTDQLYIDVECWGQLAVNVAASLKKGFPVSVCGKLVTETWEVDSPHPEKDKEMRSKIVLKAHQVSFELSHYQVSSVRSVPSGNTLQGQKPVEPKSKWDLVSGGGDEHRVSAEDALEQVNKAKEREKVGAAAGGEKVAAGKGEADTPPF